MTDDRIKCGEKVSAVIRNTQTGKITRVEEEQEPKYKIEVRITDLSTGEVEEIEEYR